MKSSVPSKCGRRRHHHLCEEWSKENFDLPTHILLISICRWGTQRQSIVWWWRRNTKDCLILRMSLMAPVSWSDCCSWCMHFHQTHIQTEMKLIWVMMLKKDEDGGNDGRGWGWFESGVQYSEPRSPCQLPWSYYSWKIPKSGLLLLLLLLLISSPLFPKSWTQYNTRLVFSLDESSSHRSEWWLPECINKQQPCYSLNIRPVQSDCPTLDLIIHFLIFRHTRDRRLHFINFTFPIQNSSSDHGDVLWSPWISGYKFLLSSDSFQAAQSSVPFRSTTIWKCARVSFECIMTQNLSL